MTKIVRTTIVSLLVLMLVSISAAAAAVGDATSAEARGDVKCFVSVYYARPDVPPGLADKDKDEPAIDNTAYALLNQELTSTATYFVNPEGAPNGAVGEIQEAFAAWDAVTSSPLFNYGGASVSRGWELDGENTVSWIGIIPRDVVAVAATWTLGDADSDGLLDVVEFDITFNALHKWAIDPDDEGPVKLKREFDVQNVATHEVGHVVGLKDLYDEEYRELTMYGYTSKGETGKITLEEGDIAGAQYLYGTP